MLVEQKPLMRALRRSQTSSDSSPSNNNSSSQSSPWIHLRSVLLIVASSSSSSSSSPSPVSSDRLKSPWSRRRRKHALLAKQWKSLFDADGKLSDGRIRKLLKKVRSGGVEPSIRAEVWPFLLGLYDVKSTQKERDAIGAQKRKEYLDLRRQCRQNLKFGDRSSKSEIYGNNINESGEFHRGSDSPVLEEVDSARASLLVEGMSPEGEIPTISGHILYLKTSSTLVEEKDECGIIDENISEEETESSDSDSSEESDDMKPLLGSIELEDNEVIESTSYKMETRSTSYMAEDLTSWQRIMRVDAVRANSEWIVSSPPEASVSEVKARRLAESVGLKDYDHLEPCMINHAARLVAILEAYALYDSETGYCQGMSDLLSPIISVISDDHLAFWCFVGFMRKARHNFRLDEMGIRRQLKIVSKIIKGKDSHLYKHLEKLQAEDCFFVYRMVVVLFRRELTFEQTLCLWEVMWADQAAIRAGIGKSTWGRMRLRAPPTDDLLLYVIAASVLQKRKLITEKYSSMDEIMWECNSMTGHLDVWKLLDDAHDLVVTLHDKI